MLFCSWRIVVCGDCITIHRLFHQVLRLNVSDIDRAEVLPKGKIVLYRGGKKLAVVNKSCSNYRKLFRLMKQNGKVWYKRIAN